MDILQDRTFKFHRAKCFSDAYNITEDNKKLFYLL